MSTIDEPRGHARLSTETGRRRNRWALFLGFLILAALVAGEYFLQVQNQRAAQGNAVAVLKASQDIQAGTTITAAELSQSQVSTTDRGVLAGLVMAGQRNSLVGQVATQSVRAGQLIPAGLGVRAADTGKWQVPLPVRAMPAGLHPGDHVALVVSSTAGGQPIELVAAQDVQVLQVGSTQITVWLPANQAAQMQWYADHGGVVVDEMAPGAVQPNLPAGQQNLGQQPRNQNQNQNAGQQNLPAGSNG